VSEVRTDTYATALFHIIDMSDLDLSYTVPLD
jgi:hypothetical protein